MIKKMKKTAKKPSKKELRQKLLAKAVEKFRSEYGELVEAKNTFADLLPSDSTYATDFIDKVIGKIEFDYNDLTDYHWMINFNKDSSELEIVADTTKDSLGEYPRDGAEWVFNFDGPRTTFTYENEDCSCDVLESVTLNIFLLDESIVLFDSAKCLSSTLDDDDECDC